MTVKLASKSLILHLSHSKLLLRRGATILLLFVLNVSSALPQNSPASTPSLTTQYDRFKDETTVGISTMLENYTVEIPFAQMQEFLLLLAGFTYKGQHLTVPPATIRIAFQSQARSWRFSEGSELLGIIDGTRMHFGTMSYSRKDLGAGHIEIMRLDMSTDIFLKIAGAKTAELRLDNKEVRLGTQQLAALATLAKRLTGADARQSLPIKKSDQPVMSPIAPGLSTDAITTKQSSSSSPVGINSCPIEPAQVQPLRGFRIGMSIAEALNRHQDAYPSVSRPDEFGVRAIQVRISRSQDTPGATGLDMLELKFLDDRLYRIEALYSVGKEWNQRPLSEFARSFSRGVGINSSWTVESDRHFKLDCGGIRFDLIVDDESLLMMPQSKRTPLAMATFTLSDTLIMSQLKSRHEEMRQKEEQRKQQRRETFRP